MHKKIYSYLLISFLLSACSAGLLYNADVKLSSVKASSDVSGLTVQVPFGWYEVTNNTDTFTDILLVNDSQTAVLSINPVNSEITSTNRTKPEITRIRDLMISLKKSQRKRDIKITRTEDFQLNDKNVSAFEYTASENDFGRTVIFTHTGNYYECTVESKTGEYLQNELFSLQNSVVNSIR